ncbi:MAG: hypothetical protein PHQ96_03175 [Candidatus Omnitrophica bacterium]|nr:hypothetical protein [Candidatus Omnitrophota bacterium]
MRKLECIALMLSDCAIGKRAFYSPSPNTLRLAAGMKAMRIISPKPYLVFRKK